MTYIAILIVTLIFSAITNIVFFIKYRNVGTLRIDHSDPNKDIYRFDIDSIDDLSKRKRIVLNVDNKADLSQN